MRRVAKASVRLCDFDFQQLGVSTPNQSLATAAGGIVRSRTAQGPGRFCLPYHPDANIQYHASHLRRRDNMLANQKGYAYYAYAMAMEKCDGIGIGVGVGEACGSDGERKGQRDD